MNTMTHEDLVSIYESVRDLPVLFEKGWMMWLEDIIESDSKEDALYMLEIHENELLEGNDEELDWEEEQFLKESRIFIERIWG